MAGTINVPNAVGSYYKQLFMLNPSGIVPHIPTSVNELFELDVSELGVSTANTKATTAESLVTTMTSADFNSLFYMS